MKNTAQPENKHELRKWLASIDLDRLCDSIRRLDNSCAEDVLVEADRQYGVANEIVDTVQRVMGRYLDEGNPLNAYYERTVKGIERTCEGNDFSKRGFPRYVNGLVHSIAWE